MPTYDYLCPANGRVIEVSHKMAESIATWGDLCRRAGIALDGTPGLRFRAISIGAGNCVAWRPSV